MREINVNENKFIDRREKNIWQITCRIIKVPWRRFYSLSRNAWFSCVARINMHTLISFIVIKIYAIFTSGTMRCARDIFLFDERITEYSVAVKRIKCTLYLKLFKVLKVIYARKNYWKRMPIQWTFFKYKWLV